MLVVGPHPDDQELGMGATIAKMVADGHRVTLLDLTDGEPTPHGSPELRAAESAAAAEILGVDRIMLGQDHGFVNREVVHSVACRHAVAGVLRTREIDWIFCPDPVDAHPDHRAATRIVEDARFDAKLTKTDIPGQPRHPSRLVYYFCTHLKTIPNPSFLVDTTGFQLGKQLEQAVAKKPVVKRAPKIASARAPVRSRPHNLDDHQDEVQSVVLAIGGLSLFVIWWIY